MKICIVTVYRSLNSGSFLQAYALMKTLQGLGHEVVFLAKGVKNQRKTMLGNVLGAAFTLNFKRASFAYQKWQGFANDQRAFRVIPYEPSALAACDLFVFGSDEIWNVARKGFAKRPIFWGQGIDSLHKVAYAPSINRATLEQLRAAKYPEPCLRQMGRILVRDSYSKEVLSQLVQREIAQVVDPTLLLRREEYELPALRSPDGGYILLYAYGSLGNRQQIERIRQFAKEKSLPLVSINDCFGWCDYNVAASPLEFPAWVRNARYVITETFHGTVFSILFGKPFASYAGEKLKVNELLAQFGLQSRRVEPDSPLQGILDAPIDYEAVHQALEREREHSLALLREAVGSCGAVR